MYHGFDYSSALTGTAQERMIMMAGAIEWILELQHNLSAKETDEAKKKLANRRYQDAVLALSKAYSLAGASDQAQSIREEVGFFQAIRSALYKSQVGSGQAQQDKDFAVQQLISRAVISTEIVDIFSATGLATPDISILSDEFLDELKGNERKNLSLEVLKKLLNDAIKSRSRSNITQTKAFTERLEAAVARYHSNAITTAEVIQELIELAKQIRAAREKGEETGLTEDEIAFYDALAENVSAVEVLGDKKLKLIAHELLEKLKANVSIDWARKESARARMRLLVKKILKTYGYPPDLQDDAVKTVLQQAEALCATWEY
jgi:type I restriction enzyme R subunit